MSKLSVLAVLAFGVAASLAHPTTRNSNLIWWPKDDGTGVVPAFLHSDPSTRPSIRTPYDNVRFHLYTQRTMNAPYELMVGDTRRLDASDFSRSRPVKILIHGFSSSHTGGFTLHTKEAYLNIEDVNVIAVDWSTLAAAPWYDIAAGHTGVVGTKTADFIQFLLNEGIPNGQIHVVGHSLGAHGAGFAGAAMNGQISRITALDAALPLFGDKDDSQRIDPTDAIFVDVIHTAGGGLLEGGLAFREPRGDVDFYPNEGEHQPGCGADAFGTCSHSRAYEYFGESIANPTGFRSCQCFDWADFLGQCNCAQSASMGHNTPTSARGLYYLHTNGESPFAQG